MPPDAVSVAEPPKQISGLAGAISQTGSGFTITVFVHELLHPLASVTVTVYVVVTTGLTVIEAVVSDVLHRKDTPPDAVSVAELPIQISGSGHEMSQTGSGFTVTVVEHELLQPFASVTVTVYVVVVVGLTVMEAVVAEVLHRNDVPPDAVSVVEFPIQIAGLAGVILHVGSGFTVTVVEQELLHPFSSVTVTVYVVVTRGLTFIDAVVSVVLHRNEVPPEAVRVVEPPTQIAGSAGVMLHVGKENTVISPSAGSDAQPFAEVTVTVKAMFIEVVTEMEEVISASLHKKLYGCRPPCTVAFNVAELPGQIVGELTATCGLVKKLPKRKSFSSAPVECDARV